MAVQYTYIASTSTIVLINLTSQQDMWVVDQKLRINFV